MIQTPFCGRCRHDCEGGQCYYTSPIFLLFVMELEWNMELGVMPEEKGG